MKNFAKPTLILLTGLLVGAMLLIATPAFSQVVGSRHDLTTNTGSAPSTTSDTDEVCVFCHSPHGVPGQPLWNRGTSAAAYTMYDATWSATMDMTVATGPQGVSLACLTCHDGTVAYDNLINGTTVTAGDPNYTAGGADLGWSFTAGDTMTGGAPMVLGADLRDDHPISVTYDDTLDSGNFQPLATVQGTVLQLYTDGTDSVQDQVECGTCHDPHDVSNIPFLRMTNAGSAMCVTCHIK